METHSTITKDTSQQNETTNRVGAKNIKAYGTHAAAAPLSHLNINRRRPTPHDVEIDILLHLLLVL